MLRIFFKFDQLAFRFGVEQTSEKLALRIKREKYSQDLKLLTTVFY